MPDLADAQDPRELFDVVTAEGEPTGITKERSAVHRDGDWHRAIHVWVIGETAGEPYIVFQRRSFAKDTNPGRLDATVGGHFRAGEGVEQTVREVEEEIGVAVELNSLRFAGTRICVHESEAGIRDRELQSIYFLRDERPLTAFTPHPAELAALVRFPLLTLLDLFSGAAMHVTGSEVAPGATVALPVTYERGDFIFRVDRYPYRVAVAAVAMLREEPHVVI